MKNFLTFLLFALIMAARTYAQEAPKVRFEKVSEEEMKMNVYQADTAAEAVILFDDGSSEVSYDLEKGFMLTYERFVRIKILKQSGTNWGNFSIPLYSSAQNKEDLRVVKGTTFNYENGKIVKTEMKKESVFKERENKYWEMVRLSLPSVKIGSVIDLKYSIYSPMLWNLRSWNFQYLIPVKWSQYEIAYPEYFAYNHASLGYHSLHAETQSQRQETINYTSSSSGDNGQKTQQNHTITYMTSVYKYSANDVPAMKKEPYVTTLDNYTTMLKTELASTDFTKIGGKYKSYTNSWSNVVNELLDDEDFGSQLKSANFAKEDIASIISGRTDEKQKMLALYSHVQRNIKWNGIKSYMPSKPLRKIYSEKTGNSAEVNLTLIAMLNSAGIDANPVILSTRENGIIFPAHASLSDCNYIIARAMINGAPVLLDATEQNLPAGLIPFRCLNGLGRLVKKDSPDEVELTNPRSGSTTMVNIELKDGKMTGRIFSNETGLNAFDSRETIRSAGSPKEYFEKMRDKSTEIQFIDYSFSNLDSLYLPVEKAYTINLPDESEADAEMLYINPVLVNRISKNPFTAPTREYPVDYGTTTNEAYQMNLVIPEGYAVEELPKSKALSLENKAGSFIYKIEQADNNIACSLRLSLNKTIFLPTEYPMLQEFYNMIVAKESEQIVLKKISQ